MLLSRHGTSTHNTDKPGILDDGDPPLHTEGHVQAYRMSRFVVAAGGVDVIITSPLLRAYQTAEPVSRATGAEIIIDERATEYDWGMFAGKPKSVVFTTDVQRRADYEGYDFRPPGGQTMREAARQYSNLIDDAAIMYAGLSVLVISHKFKMQAFIGETHGLSRDEARRFDIGNCTLRYVDPTEILSSPPTPIYPDVRPTLPIPAYADRELSLVH